MVWHDIFLSVKITCMYDIMVSQPRGDGDEFGVSYYGSPQAYIEILL